MHKHTFDIQGGLHKLQVDEPAADAWNGFVASLQANQAKQVKQTAKKQPRLKQVVEEGWSGTVAWNNVWDDAVTKEASRPQHMTGEAQPETSAGALHFVSLSAMQVSSVPGMHCPTSIRAGANSDVHYAITFICTSTVLLSFLLWRASRACVPTCLRICLR